MGKDMEKKRFWTRRKFFANLGFGAIGITFLANKPFQLFNNSKKVLMKERVKINSNAVKRVK